LRRFTNFDARLTNFSDVFYLVIYAILLPPAVGATLGIISFAVSPEETASNFVLMWWHWWIAHSLSLSMIVPLLLTWLSDSPDFEMDWQLGEFLLALGCVSVTSILLFLRFDFLPIGNFPLGHVLFPFLFWIALRFTPREVSLAGFITIAMSIIGTVQKTGPFSRPDLDTNLFLLGTFVFSVVLVTLILSSIFAQRQRTREELQNSHDDLEKRVQERTLELQNVNQQLVQEVEERKVIAQDLATARDEAVMALNYKNQILANVSHDARTPLSIMMLHLDLLQRQSDNLTDKQLNRIKTIHSSSGDLLLFINNLLDAANLQSQDSDPVIEQIDLRDFLENHTAKLEALAEDKHLAFTLDLDDNLPSTIESDKTWLTKIIMNLVTNALKFTKEGSVILKASKSSSALWQLSVIDTGIGISESVREKIFEPFWQVDGSATRQANRGVGLGLAIVKQYVEALQGEIQVDSTLEQGTSIHISFPLQCSEVVKND
ncbi:MAG: ATP-binding protein, partial [Chloroflexota bacterium]